MNTERQTPARNHRILSKAYQFYDSFGTLFGRGRAKEVLTSPYSQQVDVLKSNSYHSQTQRERNYGITRDICLQYRLLFNVGMGQGQKL